MPRYARLSRADPAKHGQGVRNSHHAIANQIYGKVDEILANDPTIFTQEEHDKITYFTRDIQNRNDLPKLYAGLSESRFIDLKNVLASIQLPPPNTLDTDPDITTMSSLDDALTDMERGAKKKVSVKTPVYVKTPVSVNDAESDDEEFDEEVEMIRAKTAANRALRKKLAQDYLTRLCPGLDGFGCTKTKVHGLKLCSACNRKQEHKPIKELEKQCNRNNRALERKEAAKVKKMAMQSVKRNLEKAVEASQKELDRSDSEAEMSD